MKERPELSHSGVGGRSEGGGEDRREEREKPDGGPSDDSEMALGEVELIFPLDRGDFFFELSDVGEKVRSLFADLLGVALLVLAVGLALLRDPFSDRG